MKLAVQLKTKRFIGKYLGILVGSAYGLLLRTFVFDQSRKLSVADLFSVTFIWIVPALIGITPFLFATTAQLRSTLYKCMAPFFTILLFFIFCFVTRIEDLVCIVIIALPFMTAGIIAGFLFGQLILHIRKRNILSSVLLIPLLCSPIEKLFKTPSEIYEVKNSALISNSPDTIWQNVVRVKNINEDEYSKGFFNYAGIPRPLYAELDKDGVGAKRIGHFEGGLLFNETVTDWEPDKKVSFNIQVIPSSIRQTIFDQHILKGGHFKFIGASYTLKRINVHQTLLTLTSSYKLDTHINAYASFWGDELLSDFQQRLLDVIKKRCDR